MADVFRLPSNLFGFSSSVVNSFSSSLNSLQSGVPPHQKSYKRILSAADSSTTGIVARFAFRPTKQFDSFKEFLSALSQAGDRLVIVEFYGTWCASCRALFPKLCKTTQEHPEILFLKVNFDENKPMCKSLNVKVLPYFHFYRGADGLLESFSCSLAKFQKIKDAIKAYNTGGGGSITGPPGPQGVGDINLETLSAPEDGQPGSSTTYD